LILAWIKKNLDVSDNPQKKVLTGNLKRYWHYRIVDYRLIYKIKDDILLLICVAAGHRKISISNLIIRNI